MNARPSRYYVLIMKFRHRVLRRIRRLLGIKKTVYVQERVAFYKEIWESAAKSFGFEFRPLSATIWEIRQGESIIARINNYIVSLDDPVTLDIAGDKSLTFKLLADAGLTLPGHRVIALDSVAEMRAFIAEHPGPFVVKPARNTSSGLGVSTNLYTYRQCLDAAAVAFAYCDDILIEEHVAGESYRLLFLGQRMICASRRTGVRVTGDGQRTVAELLESGEPDDKPIADARRWSNDRDVQTTLASQGLTLRSIPAPGETVLVRSAGRDTKGSREIRTVYTEEVSDLLCPEIIEEGRRASEALRSELCGVDIITTDPSVPLRTSKGTINEINTTPGLHHHYHVTMRQQREPLANTVLRHLAERKKAPTS